MMLPDKQSNTMVSHFSATVTAKPLLFQKSSKQHSALSVYHTIDASIN